MTTRDEIERAIAEFGDANYALGSTDEADYRTYAERVRKARERLAAAIAQDARPDGDVTISANDAALARFALTSMAHREARPAVAEAMRRVSMTIKTALDAAAHDRPGGEG